MGSSAHPLASSLAPLTRSLAPHCSLRSHAPLRSLAHLLAHSLAHKLVGQYIIFLPSYYFVFRVTVHIIHLPSPHAWRRPQSFFLIGRKVLFNLSWAGRKLLDPWRPPVLPLYLFASPKVWRLPPSLYSYSLHRVIICTQLLLLKRMIDFAAFVCVFHSIWISDLINWFI